MSLKEKSQLVRLASGTVRETEAREPFITLKRIYHIMINLPTLDNQNQTQKALSTHNDSAFTPLKNRGIATTAQNHGWQPKQLKNSRGWSYPIYDYKTGKRIATRWKSAEKSGMKYGWIPSKPKNPNADWYILPITPEFIEISQGTAILANGEPSLLAYHSAGIHNVIATTLSEIAVPKNILEVFAELGISRLVYPVDNDEAGTKSAIKWRDALRGSGVDFEAFSWGNVADKADANDIWIESGFNSHIFIQHLDSTQSLSLPEPQIKPVFQNDIDFEQTPQGLIDSIASRLGVTGWKSNGWSRKNVSSPFREDKNPSATLNQASGVLHDFASGESYSPTEIAEQLGIDWKRYYPQQQQAKKQQQAPKSAPKRAEPKLYILPAKKQAERPTFDNRGLPDSFVAGATLANGGKSDIALMISSLIASNDNQAVTIKDIARITGKSYRTAQKSIKTLIDLFVIQEERKELTPLEIDITTKGSIRSYLILSDRDSIASAIIESIERRLIEMNFKHNLPMPDLHMASQIGADKPIFDSWRAMFMDSLDSAEREKIEAVIKRKVNEWRETLHNPACDTFSYEAEELPSSITEWRIGRMKRLHKIDPTRLNSEWQMKLGTFSKSTVLNIRKKCGFKTVQNKPEVTTLQHMKHEVLQQPELAVKLIYAEMRNAEKEHKAVVVACRIHTSDGTKYYHEFAKSSPSISLAVNRYAHNGKLRGIEFTLQGASTYEVMQFAGYENEDAQENEWGYEEYIPETIAIAEETEEAEAIETEETEKTLPTEYQSEFLHDIVARTYRDITGFNPEPDMNDLDRLTQVVQHWEAQIMIKFG